MKARALPAVAALFALAACSNPDAPTSPAVRPSFNQNPNDEIQSDPNVHVQFARGYARPGGGSSPNMTWHGGPVQHGSPVTAIFWGTQWSSSSFVGDKITGLDAFYSGVGGSNYMKTNTEYTDGSGNVSASVSYSGHLMDLSAAPSRSIKTSAILAEVCKMVPNPVAGAYYPVYTDTPRGHASYCAWHSSGTCNGVQIQFGFFFSLDGDAGCDPGDTQTSHSQGLAALANVSGHELSEMVTDPQLNAWYDGSGAENADKCAWTFNGLESFGGQSWLIQGNWSNAAYNANTGYTKGGCINGN